MREILFGRETPWWLIATLTAVFLSGTLLLTPIGVYLLATKEADVQPGTVMGWAALLGGLGSATAVGVLITVGLIHHRLDRTSLADQARLSAQREVALAATSHDLRNPVGAIALGAEVLAMEARAANNAALADLADEISNAAKRTTLLIADLLDASRADAGALNLVPEHVDLDDVVVAAIEDLALSHGDRAALVGLQLGDFTIVADRARLRAAVRNLLENALRYAEGPYLVRVTQTTANIELHIEDSGPGIPRDEREQILQRFQRGSTAHNTSGTGLGLWLAAAIAASHGGRLQVGDSPLGGADFVISLPAAA